MNKYQEALDRIMNDDYDFPNDYYGEDRATAMERDEETLQELIERATAKKLYYEGDGYWDGQLIYDTAICPCCGRRFEVDYDEHSEYCPSCGQALDWSEEE